MGKSAHIACVGVGFVGLETALSFSEAGFEVTAVDTDRQVFTALTAGQAPTGAEDDADRIESAVDSGRLQASMTVAEATDADVYIISVPTPVTDTNQPDLTNLRAAATTVANVLDEGDLVVQQSTVYPGCTREVIVDAIEAADVDIDDVGVAYVPERYSPGNDISKETPRVVGATSEQWRDRTATLYREITTDIHPVSSLEAAESTKQLENIQRDVNIALMNEAAVILDGMDIDIWEVIEAADTKWNFHHYEPGLGVGGHCIAVDPHYFMYAARQAGQDPSLISAARQVNERMPDFYVNRITAALSARDDPIDDTTVGILGITYKPGVKDLRNSQPLVVADLLTEAGVSVQIYDPLYADEAGEDDSRYSLAESPQAAAAAADCLLLGTAHEEFIDIDLAELAATAATAPLFVDPYGFYETAVLSDAGFMPLRTAEADRQEVRISDE